LVYLTMCLRTTAPANAGRDTARRLVRECLAESRNHQFTAMKSHLLREPR